MPIWSVRYSESKIIGIPFCFAHTPINRASFLKHKSYPNGKYSPILKCVHRIRRWKYYYLFSVGRNNWIWWFHRTFGVVTHCAVPQIRHSQSGERKLSFSHVTVWLREYPCKTETVVVSWLRLLLIMILPGRVQWKLVQVQSGLLTITTDDFNWRFWRFLSIRVHLAECIVIGRNAKAAGGDLYFVSLITFFLIK